MVFMAPLFAGLAAYTGTAFTALVGFLAVYITKKVAVTLAALAMVITITTALWAALAALAGGIAVSLPSEVNLAMGWIVPANIKECLSVYMTARLARFVYDVKMQGIKMRMSNGGLF